MVRLGLVELLTEEHLEAVGFPDAGSADGWASVLHAVSEVRPDVVVLDLDDDEAMETAIHLTAGFPAIKVIACSCEEPVMQVFPPFHHGESYLSDLRRDLLAAALRS